MALPATTEKPLYWDHTDQKVGVVVGEKNGIVTAKLDGSDELISGKLENATV